MRRTERGTALVVSFVALLLVGTVSSVMLARMQLVSHEGSAEREELRDLYAAEGGLEAVRHALARGEKPPETAEVGGRRVHLRTDRAGDGAHVRARAGNVVLRARIDADGRVADWTRVR